MNVYDTQLQVLNALYIEILNLEALADGLSSDSLGYLPLEITLQTLTKAYKEIEACMEYFAE